MCGRSSLTKTEKEIEARFHATFYSEELEKYNPLPNYNVAPTHFHPVIQMQDIKHIHILRWGLIPSWAKDKSIGSKMINARSETLTEKSAFKRLLTSKRCLIPLDGFYEWERAGKGKIPYRIITTDQEIFSVAGLWDSWIGPETKNWIHTFTIITVPANKIMEDIHDRMPAILTKENENYWLEDEIHVKDALSLLKAYDSENMKVYEVSDRVNSVKHNDADLIAPIEGDKKAYQTSLF